jgi:hypothetical protein
MLACSILTATWYPGSLGDTDGDAFEIVASGDKIDGGTMFSGGMRQLVQAGSYVRGDQPDHWARGNRTASLGFTKYIRQSNLDPRAGLVAGFAHALSLPASTGWLHLEIDGEETDYSIDQVVFEELSYELRHLPDHVGLRYVFKAGELAVYSGDPPAAVYEEGEILMEGSTPTSRGAILMEGAVSE